MKRLTAAEKYKGLCECGDHAWALLTKGYVTVVSPQDAHMLSDRAHQALVTESKVYAMVTLDKMPRYLHRLIAKPAPGFEVDHWNTNSLDNRRPNFRVCEHFENSRNHSGWRNSPWPYKGIRFRYLKWRAHVRINGKVIDLGGFGTPEEAARAYDAATIEHYGEFARPNFQGEQ